MMSTATMRQANIFYCTSSGGFYTTAIHQIIPNDAIELTMSEYVALIEGQGQGFQIFPPDENHEKPYLDVYVPEALSLSEAKERKRQKINTETESAILAGFDYEVDGEVLHFAYDTNDQQNFADTANMVNFSLRGIPGVPESIPWNGWDIEKDENGAEVSRSLVRLDLDANAFLALYMEGAMMHKAGLMERGGQRKAQVEAATTIEELEGI